MFFFFSVKYSIYPLQKKKNLKKKKFKKKKSRKNRFMFFKVNFKTRKKKKFKKK
jgi:hypothetical protein